MFELFIIGEKENIIAKASKDDTILDVLTRENISVPSYCGGNGSCGKCKVTVIERGMLMEKLACQTKALPGMQIMLYTNSGNKLSDVSSEENADEWDESKIDKDNPTFAVDLGTTTVAVALCDKDGNVFDVVSGMNILSPYGADVITRTSYIMEHTGGLELMQEKLKKQIRDYISMLCIKHGIEIDYGRMHILISGNTIMQHIYAGLSPEHITKAPFRPTTLFREKESHKEMYFLDDGEKMSPCVSGYVGGDIVAGLYFLESEGLLKEDTLFIDIGTNGEMGFFSNGRIICASTATGPAFEGGEISCGMPGLGGAIDKVWLKDSEIMFHTIDDTEPVGICGSGIVDLCSILIKQGLVDETGRMREGIEDIKLSDGVTFSQQDVRKVQLAKAAVAAGIKTLLWSAGKDISDVKALYIAGGFGVYMDKESAANIGLIPGKLLSVTETLGNTSLKGTALAQARVAYLDTSCDTNENADSDKTVTMEEIADMCDYIELSGNEVFNEFYIEDMYF